MNPDKNSKQKNVCGKSIRILSAVLIFILAFTMIPWITDSMFQANAYSCTDEWSDWTTVKPVEGAVFESRKEYRSRNKETMTSRSDTNDGWILEKREIDSSWSYGEWSEWSETKVTSSYSETSRTEVQYKTQYNYSRWASNSNGSGTYGPREGTWGGVYCGYYIERGWAPTSLPVDAHLTYVGAEVSYSSGTWFNEVTRTVYCYREGTRGYTYYWYRTGDWSDWTDEELIPKDSLEVEARTLYRVKNDGTHKWSSGKVTRPARYLAPGVKTFTCTACGATRTETIPKLNPAAVTPAKARIVSARVAGKKLTIKWNRIKANTKGYQVAIKNKKTQKIKYYKVKAGSKSRITKKIKLKTGTYAVMVRAYNVTGGETIYGRWSNIKSGKVK